MAPILSEFAAVTTMTSVDKPPLDSKQRLSTPWKGIPKGAKLLQFFGSGGETSSFNCAFGIYKTPASWIKEAKIVEHPFDVYHPVPDHLLRVLFDVVAMGPSAIMKRCNALLNKWINASELHLI